MHGGQDLEDLDYSNYRRYIHYMDFDNATAIFNEVNNALKQKNADLNPISVSFFPAYIPIGTHLYHSNHNGGKIPESYEWTAMDYEFSYNFAHFARGRHGPSGGPRGKPPGGPWGGPREHPPEEPDNHGAYGPADQDIDPADRQNRPSGYNMPGNLPSNQNLPGNPEEKYPPGSYRDHRPPPGRHGMHGMHGHRRGPPPDHNSPACLLTFEVTRPLDRLIYLGGASAAKSRTGEMDTQYILSGASSYDDFDERWAAERICSLYPGIDGYIRLEIGFEVVICDFSAKMRLVSNVTLSNVTQLLHFPPEESIKQAGRGIAGSVDLTNPSARRSRIIDGLEAMSGFEHYQAGERVYQGENRILIDYTKFVTPLNRTFIDPDPYRRRICNISSSIKEDMIKEVKRGIEIGAQPYEGTDWQKETTAIERKFGPMLANINASLARYFGAHGDSAASNSSYDGPAAILGTNLTTYTFNFIRRYADGPKLEFSPQARQTAIWDYVHPYLPVRTANEMVIFNALVIVQERIVSTVAQSFSIGRRLLQVYAGQSRPDLADEISALQMSVRDLIDTLRWSVFYRCRRTCGPGAICFIPTWGPSPLGWGHNSLGKETGRDGVERISEDCKCLGYRNLM